MISKPVEELSKQTLVEGTTTIDIRDPIEVATTLAFLIGLLQVKYASEQIHRHNSSEISFGLGCKWTAKAWLLGSHHVRSHVERVYHGSGCPRIQLSG